MNQDLQFQIGQMTGQLNAIQGQLTTFTTQVASLDQRLRKTELDVKEALTKIGFIGIVCGAVGSFLLEVGKYLLTK